MTSAAANAPVDQIWWRGIRLERVTPRAEESDRFEAPQFGGHFPLQIWVARRGPNHQWCASLEIGCVAYSYDVEDALECARERAIDSLYRQAARLENLGQGDD